jgi:hypothetical protein
MPPTNANPGAGGVGVHGISKSDTASPTRNQILAQTNPAARSAAVIRFILNEALALGIRVGAAPDASEMIVVIPMRVPRDVAQWFEHELFIRQAEIVQTILQENAMRTGELVPDAVEAEGVS